jgi:serine/threonine protein kinase
VLNRNPLTDTVLPTASPLSPETCSHLISDTCSTVIDVTGGVAPVNTCRRNRRGGKNWMHGRTCFSFGAVLYEMATGRMAFTGSNAAIVHEAILNRAPVPVARLKPELSPKLGEIIGKALEKDLQAALPERGRNSPNEHLRGQATRIYLPVLEFKSIESPGAH